MKFAAYKREWITRHTHIEQVLIISAAFTATEILKWVGRSKTYYFRNSFLVSEMDEAIFLVSRFPGN